MTEIVRGDAIVVRVEPDGFGLIQDKTTSRVGIFTPETTRVYSTNFGKLVADSYAVLTALKQGSRVRFVAEDRGELLNITELSVVQ